MTEQQREYMKTSVPPRFWDRFRRTLESGHRAEGIRMKCLDCMGYQQAEVRRCNITHCSLWRFRMGDTAKPADLEKAEAEPVPE